MVYRLWFMEDCGEINGNTFYIMNCELCIVNCELCIKLSIMH